jgi:hypothetical protein
VRINAIDLEIGHTMLKRFRISEADPDGAQAEVILKTWFRRDPWKTRIETHTRFSSTADDFVLQGELAAYEGDEIFFTRAWNRRVKRRLL